MKACDPYKGASLEPALQIERTCKASEFASRIEAISDPAEREAARVYLAGIYERRRWKARHGRNRNRRNGYATTRRG